MKGEPLPPGVHVALATTLTPDLDIDTEATRRLVDHVLDGGVHGLNVMGSTGEVASLSEPKRRRLVDTVMKATGGRVPVITAMAQNSLEDAVREVEALAGQGVNGVLVTPPSYYPLNQPAVESFYRELASQSPLPLLIYNIPQFTKIVVAPSTVATLARQGVVVGIKDSSRDFEYFSQVVYSTRGANQFRVFTGSDTMLLASMIIGGDGTIAGGPNLAPTLAVDLYQAILARDWERAVVLQQRVLDLVMATRRGLFPAGIKAGLEILGIGRAMTLPPIPAIPREDRDHLRATMDRLGLLPVAGKGREAA